MNKASRRSGFTLMEMLIVVAIIAVLVAISIPIFSISRARIRETVCTANRRSGLAVVAYTAMTEEAFAPSLTDSMAWDQVNEKIVAVGQQPFDDKICPEDGAITLRIRDGGYSLQCSIHSGTEVVEPQYAQWEATIGKKYFKDEIYIFDGKRYRCQQDHEYQGDNNWRPGIATALWELLD